VAQRRRKPKSGAAEGDRAASATDKIASLLALLATQGMETDEAAIKLDAIGFSAQEISLLLGVNLNYVNVAKHRKNKKPRKKIIKATKKV